MLRNINKVIAKGEEYFSKSWSHLLIAKNFQKNHFENKSKFYFKSYTYNDYDNDESWDEE